MIVRTRLRVDSRTPVMAVPPVAHDGITERDAPRTQFGTTDRRQKRAPEPVARA